MVRYVCTVPSLSVMFSCQCSSFGSAARFHLSTLHTSTKQWIDTSPQPTSLLRSTFQISSGMPATLAARKEADREYVYVLPSPAMCLHLCFIVVPNRLRCVPPGADVPSLPSLASLQPSIRLTSIVRERPHVCESSRLGGIRGHEIHRRPSQKPSAVSRIPSASLRAPLDRPPWSMPRALVLYRGRRRTCHGHTTTTTHYHP
ncbi:hypothetical protein B0H66DRAFT_126036 [Apodospora peruviana]|uniref:Uncharacterized protein n=1 Tax=Apodospora peruviana TaxID=516989 RepID=A0AAE0IHV6_9PEZI|nr:hypothetical protein B0H66DRAFT_126036 [Apodospora peruviana]